MKNYIVLNFTIVDRDSNDVISTSRIIYNNELEQFRSDLESNMNEIVEGVPFRKWSMELEATVESEYEGMINEVFEKSSVVSDFVGSNYIIYKYITL